MSKSLSRISKWGSNLIPSPIFRKSLILLLLITCLPTALIGLSLYSIGRERIELELTGSHEQVLASSISQFDQQISLLEQSTSQWAFNPLFNKDNLENDLSSEPNLTREIFRSLSIMSETNPLIEEVYLYIDSTATLMSNLGGYNELDNAELRIKLHKLLEVREDIYWSSEINPSELSASTNQYSEDSFKYMLFHQISGGNANEHAVIIVQLSSHKLREYFGSFDKTGVSLLFDSTGDPLFQQSDDQLGSAFPRDHLKTMVLHKIKQKTHESFVFEHEQKRYSINYESFQRLGSEWILATATDLSQVSAPVVFMSRMILFISIIGLLVSIILSWIASKRIYQPVARLLSKVSPSGKEDIRHDTDELEFIGMHMDKLSLTSLHLQNELEKQLPSLRESFILQLIQGHLNYMKEPELKRQLHYYGWNTSNQQFAIVVIQLFGLMQEEGKFKQDDYQLACFAAANIVNELTGIRVPDSHVVNLQNMNLAIITGFSSNHPESAVREELRSLSEHIATTLLSLLKIQVTITVSGSGLQLKDIPQTLEDAYQIMKYRNLTESNQIIEIDDISLKGDFKFQYPFEAEKLLQHYIRLGQEEEALQAFKSLMQELNETTGIELYVQQAMAQLVGNVHQTLLQSGFNVFAIQGSTNLYVELGKLKQLAEMETWFKNKIIIPYIREMNNSYNTQLKQAVKKVIQLIEEHYMKDWSFEEYAEQVGAANISSLSRAFKQTTGINYVEYVSKVRIEKAKKMLLDTDLRINEIAERTGYQHSWFNRVFKKHEGVTPSQYRETHKGNI
ncbi:hypothetical protein BK126_17200 [Paenibacillus sp. FSL H7-0326]|uniref:AraC family transcriptional regulator n=1 Tax=Paenibacillus sp. FSL H7-0326 TaxID=1921144 RepID=UPI00096E9C5F|nr:AraC family transcriptional regulator [Paenibacillus sp. FSL H7-0326]OMC67339.1 hypothetical protein BK126_17200 [Paenibacillus sp. FSL H7-0326]